MVKRRPPPQIDGLVSCSQPYFRIPQDLLTLEFPTSLEQVLGEVIVFYKFLWNGPFPGGGFPVLTVANWEF